MTKIDAHHHLWLYNAREYDWISEEMKVLKHDFLPVHLKREMEKCGIEGSIVIQARQTLAESSWLLMQAAENPFIKGVVGWVDLLSSNLKEQLDRFSSNSMLVGVRHIIQDELDDQFMLKPEFISGIGQLAKYGLTFDLLLYPGHLLIANQLVKLFPDQKFVLDHIGKPRIKDGTYEPWSSDLAQLASNQNVWCKISGMVAEADWTNWKRDDFNFYIDRVVNLFGTGRIMIGTDWPVCLLSAGYDEFISMAEDYFKEFSENERQQIFGRNCLQFYGIEPNT